MRARRMVTRRRLLTHRGRTTRRILNTMFHGSLMVRALITTRVRAITVAGIIVPVATRIRVGKKESFKQVKAARKSGRPLRADALKLREQILEVATELFLEQGYGSTSIEAVAARAGVSKRTFYDRFNDKAALFAAVVHYIIEHIRPPATVPLLAGANLPQILRRLAGLILQAALSPPAIALHRLVTGESSRFPELASAVEKDGGQAEATALIAGLLERELPKVKLTAQDLVFAAQQFIYMVVAVPQRRATGFGVPMTPTELELWADKAATLFLEGFKGLRK
jgi:TetR/AcrR family transcriptional regulator, mexJK operon transcriptional repressor